MHGVNGSAILRYDGAPTDTDPPPPPMIMEAPEAHKMPPLPAPVGAATPPPATRQIVLNITRKSIPNVGLRWHINNGSLAMPSTPLLAQLYARAPVSADYAIRIERGEVVDFVLNNVGDSTGPHPWHPHGHEAWFMGSAADVGGYAGQALNETRAPKCDVFMVPHNGWAVVRMQMDHSGAW